VLLDLRFTQFCDPKVFSAQKKGKAKMKTIGRVSIPKEAFLSVLKV